jgi:hypothetical protein
LPLFPTDAVPKGRRAAMELALKERRETAGRAVSCGSVLALSSAFFLFYGAISALAWANGAHPAFGVLFSIFAGGLLVSSVHLSLEFRRHLDAVAVVPAQLRLEAEAEAALEQAALDVNIKAIFWNEAAVSAEANDVGATFVDGLRAQRAGLECRRLEVEDSLKRFIAATSPKPRAVRPSESWGPVETIDLSGTDS